MPLLKGTVLCTSSGCTFAPVKGRSPASDTAHLFLVGWEEAAAPGDLRTKDLNQELEVGLEVS